MAFSQRFDEALVFASELHREQRRKGSDVPYVAHLLGVAAIAIEHGATEDEAIAALLHDAVEDQGGAATREKIRARFGDAVVAIVDGCTDSDVTPKPPWRARKERYIAHVRTAPHSVRLVSMSDKVHNVRSVIADYRVLGEEVWKRFRGGGRDGTLWYYRALVDVFRESDASPLALELERVVVELERLTSK